MDKKRFMICQARKEDIDDIMDIMNEAKETTIPREWFVADSREYVMEHIISEKTGFILLAKTVGEGIKKDEETAGFLMVHLPGAEDEENLGKHLLPDEELSRCAHIDTAAVSRQFRGNRLQMLLCEKAEEILREKGYIYAFATVHPDNRYSLENMEKRGYEVIDTVKKYGGLIRHIVGKKMGE